MITTPSPCVDLPWFAVLPDHESASSVATRLRAWARDELRHGSGRPWLLGYWPKDQFTVLEEGGNQVVLVGQHSAELGRLKSALGCVASIHELERTVSSIDGSFHLVISLPGKVAARGSLLGLRRLFVTSVSGTAVASDRSDVLAALRGAGIDEQRLAVHLLLPPALHPVSEETVWRDVVMVPPDHSLTVEGAALVRLQRRWSPPEPTRSLIDGAAELRLRLMSAVGVRAGPGKRISCDLAGLDSTSVCSIAARSGARVVGITAENPDPSDDDMQWAESTLSGLNHVQHEVIASDEMPLPYDGLLELGERFDEPCPVEVNHCSIVTQMLRAARSGSVVHLNGFGGDELIQGSLAHLHGMVRSSPYEAIRRLRVFRAAHQWPRGHTLRLLLGNHPYRDWLSKVADQIGGDSLRADIPLLDWSVPPSLPPWVTPDAHDALRQLIRDAAAGAEPLAPDRGLHLDLQALRAGARSARQYDQMARRAGVPIAAPFYDDRVVEAGLAVLPAVRINPWRYKPLIVEAMRGIVPDVTLARTTKAHWTVAQQTGLRINRRQLMAMADDPLLERLGLIDGARLRSFCARPLPPGLHLGVFDQTVACERWLRAVMGGEQEGGG